MDIWDLGIPSIALSCKSMELFPRSFRITNNYTNSKCYAMATTQLLPTKTITTTAQINSLKGGCTTTTTASTSSGKLSCASRTRRWSLSHLLRMGFWLILDGVWCIRVRITRMSCGLLDSIPRRTIL